MKNEEGPVEEEPAEEGVIKPEVFVEEAGTEEGEEKSKSKAESFFPPEDEATVVDKTPCPPVSISEDEEEYETSVFMASGFFTVMLVLIGGFFASGFVPSGFVPSGFMASGLSGLSGVRLSDFDEEVDLILKKSDVCGEGVEEVKFEEVEEEEEGDVKLKKSDV